jgi:hypothetical protein
MVGSPSVTSTREDRNLFPAFGASAAGFLLAPGAGAMAEMFEIDTKSRQFLRFWAFSAQNRFTTNSRVSAREHSKKNVENKTEMLLGVLDKRLHSAHDYTNRGALCSIFSWPETTPDEFAQISIQAAGQRNIAPTGFKEALSSFCQNQTTFG